MDITVIAEKLSCQSITTRATHFNIQTKNINTFLADLKETMGKHKK